MSEHLRVLWELLRKEEVPYSEVVVGDFIDRDGHPFYVTKIEGNARELTFLDTDDNGVIVPAHWTTLRVPRASLREDTR